MRTSPSCGCCTCEQCRIAFDDFDRADDTDIGTDWVETSGDWEIDTNTLTTGDSTAMATHTATHPDGVAAHVVSVDMMGSDPGDQLDVRIAIIDDDNYLMARVTLKDGAQCGELALIEVENGVALGGQPTQIVPGLVADEWHHLKVCYLYDPLTYLGSLSAELRTSDGTVIKLKDHDNYPSSGLVVGLGTGTVTAKASFDNFCWQVHYFQASQFDGVTARTNCPQCLSSSCAFSGIDLEAVGTDLGCAWEETTGDWEIETATWGPLGGGLAITVDTAPANLWHRIEHPLRAFTMSGVVYVKLEDTGDIAQLILCAPAGDTGGVGVEIEAGDTCGFLRIIDDGVQVGPDIAVTGLVPDQWHKVTACYGTGLIGGVEYERVLTATVTSEDGHHGRYADLVTATPGGITAALRVVDLTTKAWFSRFKLSQSYHETLAPHCPKCNDDASWCYWSQYFCDESDACEWYAESGNWVCLETSDSDAVRAYQNVNPSRINRHRVTGFASATGEATGLIYLAYVDTNTYLALSITWDNDCSTISLIQDGAAIASTNVGEYQPGDAVEFCVEYDGTTLSAWCSSGGDTRQLSAPATADADGLKVAVGTGTVSSGTVSFNGLVLYTARSDANPYCDDCDSCGVWNDILSGTAGDPVECDYTGSATYSAAYGGTAEIPAGGTLEATLGVEDEPFIAWIMFYLSVLPASVTFTVMGVTATLQVESTGEASLTITGGGEYTTTVETDNAYSLQICAYDGRLLAALYNGRFPTNGIIAGVDADGSPSGCDATVAVSSNPVYVREFQVLKRSLSSGRTCQRCHTVCDPCENSFMPSQILIEIEDCDLGASLGAACCGMIGGAFYLDMTGCLAEQEWGNPEDDLFRRVRVVFIDYTTYVDVAIHWYYAVFSGFLSDIVWQANVPKPLNCQTMSRIELSLYTGAATAYYPTTDVSGDCYDALENARAYLSTA